LYIVILTRKASKFPLKNIVSSKYCIAGQAYFFLICGRNVHSWVNSRKQQTEENHMQRNNKCWSKSHSGRFPFLCVEPIPFSIGTIMSLFYILMTIKISCS
jgi:hypothetical protein